MSDGVRWAWRPQEGKGGDSLTFHIADGRRVDGCARRKWTNRAGIARHDSTCTECDDALIIPRASPYQTAVAIGVKQTALVALPKAE
jgi:hypothetical protein